MFFKKFFQRQSSKLKLTKTVVRRGPAERLRTMFYVEMEDVKSGAILVHEENIRSVEIVRDRGFEWYQLTEDETGIVWRYRKDRWNILLK
jgi:hypothetical protein